MKNKVMIEAQIHQIKEGISQIKNLLYCMNKFIKEIEKGLDENNDEKIDKIMFEDMCGDLEEENKKLKYVIDLVMEKAGIEYIRLADGDVFTNPKNKLHISDTIQVDILNGNK